jgi:hypothetical protein
MQYYLQAPGIIGGDKKKAHEIPARIATVDPVKGVFAEVVLARHDQQQERVEGLYRKAVELRPASYDARVALGSFVINADVKNAPEAERQAREALKLDATRIAAHGLLAGRWRSRADGTRRRRRWRALRKMCRITSALMSGSRAGVSLRASNCRGRNGICGST